MSDPYAHGHHESVLRSHEWRTIANSAAHLEPLLRPGLSVLDVGAGPGTITVELAERVAPGEVVGVDASAEVVAKAAALAAARGVTNLSFRVGDAYRLDAPENAFDVVHVHQVLHHLSRPIDALREFRRVVRPDGVVSVREVDYEGTFWYPHSAGLDEWLDVYCRMHRGLGGEPASGRRLKAWARAAGFADITATASQWLFTTPEDRAWWGGMWADRALQSAFAEHALTQGVTDQDGLQRISDAWREWAADEDGWLVMPHAEVLARS
ncbi:methyltransferase domain-containing protein [Microbacterium luticocti]|uniref:methyltransferase domain-containing protein n=1 Tax=Microbacterium luticocti TaxID=451764 RepID=UPI00049106EA|nr:methyltransferase domain-containing protein [Microbacterium luticocti]